MKVQQWGTYSVRDHRRTRPFVADVLLFDKLIIPRPATEQELHFEAKDKPAPDQMQRWRNEDWDPDTQRKLLDILGEFDLAIELPWGGRAQYDWKRVYDDPAAELQCDRSELTRSIQDQIEMAKSGIPEEAAYLGTAGLLALYVANKMSNDVARKLFNRAKTPGVPVETVIAYGSYAEFQSDHSVGDKSDAELLRQAAQLASRPDFCETRQYFHGWLKQMYEGGVDRQDAYEDMLKMLSEYKNIVKKSGLATSARYAAKVAQILAPIAGLAGHGLGVGVGVAVSGAAMAVERLIPMPQVPERLRSAAVLHDARKFFGKH